MNTSKLAAPIAAGLVGWALCAAVMNLAMATTPLAEALIIHAIAAPILFIFVSTFYFQRFAYTTPLQTAFIFSCVVIFVDFFVVGLLINGSLAMFGSLLGTWIPFMLIFTATHITGLLVSSSPRYNVPVR